MSKLDRIRHFLNENKAGLAIVSDPVTVNYLTGFDCDPHERQMFLFVYENREPALFVPALEVGCIVTSQDHSFKAHFIAQAFDAKVDFCDDISFCFIQ